MDPTDVITVHGDKELMRALEELPTALHKKYVRKATREVAKMILQIARSLAPVRYGDLEASLAVRSSKFSRRRRKYEIGHSVQPREGWYTGDEYYAAFQELGWTMRNGVIHHGNSFLRPALYEYRQRWNAAFQSRMRRLIPKAVAEARRKAHGKGPRLGNEVLAI